MTFSLKGLKTITNYQYEPACGILSLLDISFRLIYGAGGGVRSGGGHVLGLTVPSGSDASVTLSIAPVIRLPGFLWDLITFTGSLNKKKSYKIKKTCNMTGGPNLGRGGSEHVICSSGSLIPR